MITSVVRTAIVIIISVIIAVVAFFKWQSRGGGTSLDSNQARAKSVKADAALRV